METLTEVVPNTFPGLFWGYSVIWVLIALYIASLARRVRSLERKNSAEKEEAN